MNKQLKPRPIVSYGDKSYKNRITRRPLRNRLWESYSDRLKREINEARCRYPSGAGA